MNPPTATLVRFALLTILLVPTALVAQSPDGGPRRVDVAAFSPTLTGPVLPTQTQEDSRSHLMKGFLIGAAGGALAGLIFYEIGDAIVDLCSDDSESCEKSPTRTEAIIGGGVIGAVAGMIVAKLTSSRAVSVGPWRGPDSRSGVAVRLTPGG